MDACVLSVMVRKLWEASILTLLKILARKYEDVSAFNTEGSQSGSSSVRIGSSGNKTADDLAAKFNRDTCSIDVMSFIRRVLRHNIMQPENFIMGAILVERLRKCVQVSKKNVEALFVFGAIASTKMNDDKLMDNNTYAQCLNMKLGIFNQMEISFLLLIDFDLFVPPDMYYLHEANFIPAFIANNTHSFSYMNLFKA